jgi:hypothetical protein
MFIESWEKLLGRREHNKEISRTELVDGVDYGGCSFLHWKDSLFWLLLTLHPNSSSFTVTQLLIAFSGAD